MTREVQLYFSYVMRFSRRKGWRMKPCQSAVVNFDCDAPFEVRKISLGFAGGHKTQIKQFVKSYQLTINGMGRSFPLAYFNDQVMPPLPFPIQFDPGSTANIRFEGEPFGKMQKTMRWALMFSGVKLYKLESKAGLIAESKAGRIGPWERAQ